MRSSSVPSAAPIPECPSAADLSASEITNAPVDKGCGIVATRPMALPRSLTIWRSLEVFPELTGEFGCPSIKHSRGRLLAHADSIPPGLTACGTGPADTDSAGLFIGATGASMGDQASRRADARSYRPMRSTKNDSPPRARPVHSKREKSPLWSTSAAGCEW